MLPLLSEDVPRHHQPPQVSSRVSRLEGLDLSWALRLCRPPGKQAWGGGPAKLCEGPCFQAPFHGTDARQVNSIFLGGSQRPDPVYPHWAEQTPTWAQPGTRFSNFQHYQPLHCQSQRTQKGMRPTLSLPLVPHVLQPIPHQGSWARGSCSSILLGAPDAKNWLTGKAPDAGKDWGQEEKGTTEDEMVGWHHRLNGCEFE